MVTGRAVLGWAVRSQRRDVAIAAVLASAHQVGEALVPVLIGMAIDQAMAGDDGRALVLWLGALAAVYLVLSWSFRIGAYAGERAGARAAHGLRLALVERVLDPRGGAESGRLPGALTAIATEDARRVGAVNLALMAGIAALVGIASGAAVLLSISLPLGLVVVLGTPLLMLLGHLLSRPLERRSRAEQERAAHASAVAADLVAGLRVLKGLGAEPAAVDRYRRTSADSLGATLRAARAEAWQSGTVLALTGVFIALVALVGGRLAAQGEVSLGQLVAAVGLALMLLGPLSVLAWVNARFAQGRASAARIADVLAAPSAVPEGEGVPPEPVAGHVRLSGVASGSLRELDLEARPGELLGVVAPDPGDAEALLRCLGRETDPDAGTVELDGVPLSTLHPAAVRASILVAAHDADLFSGDLAGTIASGDRASRDLASGDLDRVLAAAGAGEIAAALGDGASVGERGRSLSGGQRQRVALARALAADAPVLVLHDPTTAVDAVTEARIAEGLRALRRGRTTVVVTTSPALLAVTDRVVLVSGGRTGDAATHSELAARHDGYRATVLS
ncbi:ABC transporter ATP-binding protein [Actinomadura madurae]|uniref:Putative ABC transport system ATP-binding protein n=1 Tax=Actinomadura madurae TaxID=1993 RepID=A0A1I5RTG6_9ACTN|nr:ABC transporter ATP-binding protein [Actinomadura madurae]SFP61561.1 putative ABC transport system ATP-binding protein [Actinomadura madurae]SPT59142.1 Probable multidrug resistance ABC transporter ATP-binding/permease protein YheI [Actinomadura madurae]